uniref:Uncharacterized protein n=1 Tax=Oryza brachyantha TaxID=4533 RepID=J3LKG1_ORYBR
MCRPPSTRPASATSSAASTSRRRSGRGPITSTSTDRSMDPTDDDPSIGRHKHILH